MKICFKIILAISILISVSTVNSPTDTIKADTEYAEVHIFRPKQYQGGAIVFSVTADNKPIVSLKNGSRVIYKVYNEGAIDLQLKASIFTSKNINFGIVKGKKYYLKASYGDGFGSNLSFIPLAQSEGEILFEDESLYHRTKIKYFIADSTSGVVKDVDFYLSKTTDFEETIADKPSIGWLNPEKPSEKTDISIYSLQACVRSKAATFDLQISVNNEVVANLQNTKTSKKECSYNYIRNIKLEEGENQIMLLVKDDFGESSFSRKIIYKSNKKVYRGLALVIGNSQYLNTTNLKNPSNDANAMAEAFETLGFEVMHSENLSKEEMKKAIGFYLAKLRNYETGIFFYAGHGIQYNGKNYLIPVDAKLTKNDHIDEQCIDTGGLLTNMNLMKLATSIMILDACRNNPFEKVGQRVTDTNSGLTGTDAPAGSIVAFATAPGKTASDGSSTNGLYTQEIIKGIYKPNVKVEELFKRVRVNVMNQSNNGQIPWETSSLIHDFYFNPSNI